MIILFFISSYHLWAHWNISSSNLPSSIILSLFHAASQWIYFFFHLNNCNKGSPIGLRSSSPNLWFDGKLKGRDEPINSYWFWDLIFTLSNRFFNKDHNNELFCSYVDGQIWWFVMGFSICFLKLTNQMVIIPNW